MFQYLRDIDKGTLAAFADWFRFSMSTDSNFLRRTVFSDEFVFQVSGIANTQNVRIWGT